MKKVCSIIGTLLILASVCFAIVGFDKKNNYVSPDEQTTEVEVHNAYVGGDAYNLIINAGYFAGYMALSAGLMVSGSVFLVNGSNKKD